MSSANPVTAVCTYLNNPNIMIHNHNNCSLDFCVCKVHELCDKTLADKCIICKQPDGWTGDEKNSRVGDIDNWFCKTKSRLPDWSRSNPMRDLEGYCRDVLNSRLIVDIEFPQPYPFDYYRVTLMVLGHVLSSSKCRGVRYAKWEAARDALYRLNKDHELLHSIICRSIGCKPFCLKVYISYD